MFSVVLSFFFSFLILVFLFDVIKEKQALNLVWTDEDEAFKLGLENWDLSDDERDDSMAAVAATQVCVFRAWEEDWEKEKKYKKNSVVAKEKLNKKYLGIQLVDYDDQSGPIYEITQLVYLKRGGGWVAEMTKEANPSAKPKKLFFNVVRELVRYQERGYDYDKKKCKEYKQPASANITVMLPNPEDDSSNEDSDDDESDSSSEE